MIILLINWHMSSQIVTLNSHTSLLLQYCGYHKSRSDTYASYTSLFLFLPHYILISDYMQTIFFHRSRILNNCILRSLLLKKHFKILWITDVFILLYDRYIFTLCKNYKKQKIYIIMIRKCTIIELKSNVWDFKTNFCF